MKQAIHWLSLFALVVVLLSIGTLLLLASW